MIPDSARYGIALVRYVWRHPEDARKLAERMDKDDPDFAADIREELAYAERWAGPPMEPAGEGERAFLEMVEEMTEQEKRDVA